MTATGDLFFSSKGHDVPGLYARADRPGAARPSSCCTGSAGSADCRGIRTSARRGSSANTGSLGMGISKAKGMVLADRLAGRDRPRLRDDRRRRAAGGPDLGVAGTGGATARMGEITVIVDHNKIQSDTWVASVSDLGDLEAKFEAFGWHVARCDGHDLADAERDARARCAASTDRPKVIDRRHGEGQGRLVHGAHRARSAPSKFYRFHSGAPRRRRLRAGRGRAARPRPMPVARGAVRGRPRARATAPRPEPRRTRRARSGWSPAYSRALLAHAGRDPRIVALDADLVLDTGLIPFAERFPDRFVECGIAEQDMVSQAGGLALAGTAAGRPLVRLLPLDPAERADLQQRHRAHEDRLCRVARRPAARRARATRTNRCATSPRSPAVPGLVMLQPASRGRGGAGGGVLPRRRARRAATCGWSRSRARCRIGFRPPIGWSGAEASR